MLYNFSGKPYQLCKGDVIETNKNAYLVVKSQYGDKQLLCLNTDTIVLTFEYQNEIKKLFSNRSENLERVIDSRNISMEIHGEDNGCIFG